MTAGQAAPAGQAPASQAQASQAQATEAQASQAPATEASAGWQALGTGVQLVVTDGRQLES
ncbi:MAG: hypothetical protein J2P35_24430, partial [Actinobacteria bacterium]|nr:hypothetical protein [Actinomycetota bacterium]